MSETVNGTMTRTLPTPSKKVSETMTWTLPMPRKTVRETMTGTAPTPGKTPSSLHSYTVAYVGPVPGAGQGGGGDVVNVGMADQNKVSVDMLVVGSMWVDSRGRRGT